MQHVKRDGRQGRHQTPLILTVLTIRCRTFFILSTLVKAYQQRYASILEANYLITKFFEVFIIGSIQNKKKIK